MGKEGKSLIDQWRDRGLISSEAAILCERYTSWYQKAKMHSGKSPGFSEYVSGGGYDRESTHVRTIEGINNVRKIQAILGPWYMMMEKLFIHGYSLNQYFEERNIARGRKRNAIISAFRQELNTTLLTKWYRS